MQTEGLGGQQLKINQPEVLLGIPLLYKVAGAGPAAVAAGGGVGTARGAAAVPVRGPLQPPPPFGARRGRPGSSQSAARRPQVARKVVQRSWWAAHAACHFPYFLPRRQKALEQMI